MPEDKATVLVDASWLQAGRGQTRYSEMFLKVASAVAPNVTFVYQHRHSSWLRSDTTRFSPRFLRLPLRLLFNSVKYWRETRLILTLTGHPAIGARHQVIMLYDLRPRWAPDNLLQGFYARRVLPYLIRNVVGVITCSESSKRDIHNIYKVPIDKIRVVHAFTEIAAVRGTPPVRASAKPYLLMVGASYPHKNAHLTLLNHEAWQKRYDLVVVCADNGYTEKLRRMVQRLNLGPSVTILTRITDEDLAGYYRGTAALLYPSEMEGFGIPILEALTLGTQVAASDIAVFRELFQEKPHYFNPHSPDEWRRVVGEIADPTSRRNSDHNPDAVIQRYTRESVSRQILDSLEYFIRGIA